MTFADTRVIELAAQYPLPTALLVLLISGTLVCFFFFRGDRN